MENNITKKNVGRPSKDGVKRSFILERNLSERFDAYCYDTARSKTRAIEQAIEEYMKNHPID